LEETSTLLPHLLDETQERLQTFLVDAQSLSLQRYALADKLASLVSDLSRPDEEDGSDGQTKQGRTVLEQIERLQDELSRLEAGLAWATVLEQVILLRSVSMVVSPRLTICSEKALSPDSHKPSPLAATPHYKALHELVASTEATLPSEMTLLLVIVEIRDKTWAGLKEIMSQ